MMNLFCYNNVMQLTFLSYPARQMAGVEAVELLFTGTNAPTFSCSTFNLESTIKL